MGREGPTTTNKMLHSLTNISLWTLLLSPALTSFCHPPFLTTSLILAWWDAKLSVLKADPTATTYVQAPYSHDCNVEAYDGVTFFHGPSTAGGTFIRNECDTVAYISERIECPFSDPNTATCTMFMNGTSAGTVTQNSSEMSPVPVTITQGIEKLSLGFALSSDPNCTPISTKPPQPSPVTAVQTPTLISATAVSTAGAAQNPTSTPSAAFLNFSASFGKAFLMAAFFVALFSLPLMS